MHTGDCFHWLWSWRGRHPAGLSSPRSGIPPPFARVIQRSSSLGCTAVQRQQPGKEHVLHREGGGHLPSPAVCPYLVSPHTFHQKTPVIPGVGRSANNPERLAQGNSTASSTKGRQRTQNTLLNLWSRDRGRAVSWD